MAYHHPPPPSSTLYINKLYIQCSSIKPETIISQRTRCVHGGGARFAIRLSVQVSTRGVLLFSPMFKSLMLTLQAAAMFTGGCRHPRHPPLNSRLERISVPHSQPFCPPVMISAEGAPTEVFNPVTHTCWLKGFRGRETSESLGKRI